MIRTKKKNCMRNAFMQPVGSGLPGGWWGNNNPSGTWQITNECGSATATPCSADCVCKSVVIGKHWVPSFFPWQNGSWQLLYGRRCVPKTLHKNRNGWQ